jgi:hypothetical protein
MFGSSVLDVVIGMIFVYLLLSLLCSAINEYVEARLNYRGENLWRGIQLLLNGAIKEGRELALKPRSSQKSPDGDSSRPAGGDGKEAIDLATELYNHGLIRALFQDENRLPSYIPSRTFALALWNLATREIKNTAKKEAETNGAADAASRQAPDIKQLVDLKQIEEVIGKSGLAPHLQDSLITMIEEADGDFDRAVKNIEDWYDGAMDRVSGWYKRHVQWILILIGFLAAIIINADTVNIARALVQDKTLRDVIVASATEYAKENGGPSSPAGARKGGADSNSNASNSNASNSNAPGPNAPNSNAPVAGGANSNAPDSNAGREHAAKAGSAGANSANTNGGNANTAAGAAGRAGDANTRLSNSDDAGAAGGTGGTPAPSSSPNPIQQAYDKINTLGLPIGWDLASGITKDPIRGVPHQGDGERNALSWLLMKLFGLFLTGLAISQGAPFWFDLLNKFMVIRSTVKPKEKSPDEASKDKTTPRPKNDHDGGKA